MAGALARLRVAGLPERVVIDASHDNSRKDHARQPAAAADVARQVAEGNDAIVGLMLESFLVAGRQEPGAGVPLVYGQSITDACMDWDTTSEVLERLALAVRGPARGMRIAVLGVGLIGGSIGLAAREHVEGAEVVGFGRDPERLRAAADLGAIDRAAGLARGGARGRLAVLRLRARSARLPELVRARARRRRRRLRGHRRRLDQAGAGRRDRRSALRRRPPDRRRRDRRRRARARRPVPGRRLVPDAAADVRRAALRAAAPLRGRRRRAAGGARPGDAHDRLVAVFSHLPHVLANVLASQAAGACSTRARRCATSGRASAT